MPPSKDSCQLLLSIKLPQKLLSLPFAFLTALAVCSAPANAVPANSTTPQQWHLLQNSEEMGKVDILLTYDAVRIHSEKQNFYALIKAPDWKVHCYRNNEKLEWIGDLKIFSGLVMVNPFSVPKPFKILTTPTGESGTLKGLNYAKYSTGPGKDNYIYATTDIKVASQVAEFIARLYNMPNTNLLPIYRSTKQPFASLKRNKNALIAAHPLDGATELRTDALEKLSTISWQKIPYQPKSFAYPKGYTLVPDVVRITYSADSKSELNEMLDNIGFTESNKLTKNAAKAKNKR